MKYTLWLNIRSMLIICWWETYLLNKWSQQFAQLTREAPLFPIQIERWKIDAFNLITRTSIMLQDFNQVGISQLSQYNGLCQVVSVTSKGERHVKAYWKTKSKHVCHILKYNFPSSRFLFFEGMGSTPRGPVQKLLMTEHGVYRNACDCNRLDIPIELAKMDTFSHRISFQFFPNQGEGALSLSCDEITLFQAEKGHFYLVVDMNLW